MFFRVTWLWVFSVIAWLIVICWDKWHSGYSKMRKRPSIASVYLVRVSRPCQHSRPYIRHSLLHIRPFLTGWKLLPKHPRASMSLVVSLVMSLVMWGGWDSMNILLERDRRRFFYISHNLSVEMGDFTDKLLTLNNLYYTEKGWLIKTS